MVGDARKLAAAGKLTDAAALTQSAAHLAEKQPPFPAAWLWSRAGSHFTKGGQWGEADHAYGEAARRAALLGPRARAQVLRGWAQSYVARADWVHAEEKYEQALAASAQLGSDHLLTASLAASLASMYKNERDDRRRAEHYFRQVFAIREKAAPNSLAFAQAQNAMGAMALDREPDEAERLYRSAHALAERIAPLSQERTAILNNLASLAINRSHLDEAEEHLRAALRIHDELEVEGGHRSALLTNLGVVLFLRRDFDQAEELFRETLQIEQREGQDRLAVATPLHNLADVAMSRGDLDRAEALLRESWRISHELAPEQFAEAPALTSLGNLARRRKRLDEAQGHYERALEIELRTVPRSQFVTEPLQGLGDVHRARGDLEKAAEYYRRALAMRNELLPGTFWQAETLAALAALEVLQGDFDSASDHYLRSLAAVEAQTARFGGSPEARSRFRADNDRYYREYVDLLMQRARPDAALQVAERSRARALLEILQDGEVDLRRGADPALLVRERALGQALSHSSNRRLRLLEQAREEELAAVNRELDRVRRDYEEVRARIRVTSPAYAALTQPKPLAIGEVKRLLGRDTLLLQFSLGEERSYVWTVDAGSVRGRELGPRAPIEAAARRVHELVKAGPRRAVPRLAEATAELSRLILAPVAERIAAKRLLIVSDGALEYVPFAILPAPGSAAGAGASLVERHEIVQVPSVSALAALRRQTAGRPAARRAVAVLADPVFTTDDGRVRAKSVRTASERRTMARAHDPVTRSLSDLGATGEPSLFFRRLRFTRQEAEAIVATAPAGRAMKALDFDASRERAISPELAEYRIVHIATHGLLDSRRPEFSGLVLSRVDAGGNERNGFLGLPDIYNLDLPVELVVLSACETGLGNELVGEGLVGLTRGFMYAGARRVVASLWKVDDVATAELMGGFYRAMARDGLRPAAALRQAQIEVARRADWSSPYYWGAFVLHGDWE
jgi:CHAT domain-containing protein/Tfp pilus assembly protein PilF